MARPASGVGYVVMNSGNRQFGSMAFLWPALAAETASELASAMAREFVSLAVGHDTETKGPEPCWATRNQVALELAAVRLRDFSTSADGTATLVCAPFALHGATIVDFAADHSLVAALQGAGVRRLFVTDWRSATSEMRFLSIDDYLAALNVLVDEIGGAVDLIGLCQGGWMALIYAARFPAKVRRLVLAGAPIDIAAGKSTLSDLVNNTPISVFKELVEVGDGRVLGHRVLPLWAPNTLGRKEIHYLLEPAEAIGSASFRRLESRFRDWHAWTVDLPGTYYLQVVGQLFKENRLATGDFVALGRRIDLSELRCPTFLLAARDDDIVAPEQIFAVERLVDHGHCTVTKAIAPCRHLGLFMGRKVLSTVWSDIARWLLQHIDANQGSPATHCRP
jgi:poly(3-hydroxybutyrate) depolymerase